MTTLKILFLQLLMISIKILNFLSLSIVRLLASWMFFTGFKKFLISNEIHFLIFWNLRGLFMIALNKLRICCLIAVAIRRLVSILALHFLRIILYWTKCSILPHFPIIPCLILIFRAVKSFFNFRKTLRLSKF